MTVKPETIENPERDLQLANRETKAKKVPGVTGEILTHPEKSAADDELQAVRQRITTATTRVGKDTQPHCGDCFKRGWAAAVREIAGE